MRKLVLALSLIVLFSCTEDKLLVDSSYDFSSANIVTFKGNSLNPGQLTISKEAGFQSFDDSYRMALKKLVVASNETEHQSVLSEFRKVVGLRDSTYIPKMFSPMYRTICNLDRLYVAGGFVHKVLDDSYIIFTEKENVNALLRIETLVGIDTKTFRVAKHQEMSNVDVHGRTKANCGAVLADEYFYNVSGCKNDRKAWIHAAAGFFVSGNNYTPTVAAWCDATRRAAITCNFYHYNNILHSKDASFTVRVTMNTQNYFYSKTEVDMPDYTGEEEESEHFIFGESGGSAVGTAINWFDGPQPVIEFSALAMKSSSQGVGADDPTHWAELNCQ